MKAFVRSDAYAKTKFALGFFYIVFGAIVIVQMLHGVGLRLEALSGLVLGAALIGLGAVRIRAGFRARAKP
ncbi:MAG: hypothetical protein ABR591_15630 [Candidatus Velthaea sp.]